MADKTDAELLDAGRWSLWVARGISYVVYAYVLLVEVILLTGFFLLLFGANPSAGFTQWAYRNLDRALAPFRGIFTPVDLGTAGNSEVASVFDTSVLFAMIVYGVLAIALDSLIGWLTLRMRHIDREIAEVDRRAAAIARQREYDAMKAEAEARLSLQQQPDAGRPGADTS